MKTLRRRYACPPPARVGVVLPVLTRATLWGAQTDCFLGCAFGDKSGGTYRFLLPEIDNRFTKPRCKLSMHPRCACGNSAASPPAMFPPPPPRTYTEDWNIVQPPIDQDTSRGVVGTMVQRLVNGRTLDLSLRAGPMHLYEVRYEHTTPPCIQIPSHADSFSYRSQCPGEDDGSTTCALTCAREHLSRLRAYTVTGETYHSPPPIPPPPNPQPPPPLPFEAAEGDRFAPCQDTCIAVTQGVIDIMFCRDGGKGSFSPAICAYGTQVRFKVPNTYPIRTQSLTFTHLQWFLQCSVCGQREEVRSTLTTFEGDDSCQYANDQICQDGRPSTEEVHSSFVVVGEGVWAHLCPYLTDKYAHVASNSHFPDMSRFSFFHSDATNSFRVLQV